MEGGAREGGGGLLVGGAGEGPADAVVGGGGGVAEVDGGIAEVGVGEATDLEGGAAAAGAELSGLELQKRYR